MCMTDLHGSRHRSHNNRHKHRHHRHKYRNERELEFFLHPFEIPQPHNITGPFCFADANPIGMHFAEQIMAYLRLRENGCNNISHHMQLLRPLFNEYCNELNLFKTATYMTFPQYSHMVQQLNTEGTTCHALRSAIAGPLTAARRVCPNSFLFKRYIQIVSIQKSPPPSQRSTPIT
jgi:hypothetical protein